MGRTRARGDAAFVARADRRRHAGHFFIQRHDLREYPLRPTRRNGGGWIIDAAAKQAYIHDFIMTLARWVTRRRTGDKGCRFSPAVSSSALAIARASAQERADFAARRGDERAGQRERARDPGGAGNAFQGPDGHRHRAPAFDDPERGYDHRDGCGPDRGAGTTRGTTCGRRTLPGCTICSSTTRTKWRRRGRSRGDDPADGAGGVAGKKKKDQTHEIFDHAGAG